MVMGEAKRLKNTPHAVDRDYPPEIATARKRLWPEVKRLRSLASSADNIQLKYPDKIVKNGQTIQDAFPYWDTLIKASVSGEFRYITQYEQLLPATSLPGVPNMPINVNVPLMPSEIDTARNICHSVTSVPPKFPNQMPLMPPPPPPVPRQSLFMNGQNVNMRTTTLQPNMPTSLGSWRPPRPQRPVVTVSYMEEQSNLPRAASQAEASQPSSPSIFSQSFHSNSASANPTQNNQEHNSSQNQVPQNTFRPVSHSLDTTRDRSESVGRHDSRGKPRNVNNRGRSRSVRPRDKNTTNTTGAARTQQNSQNNQKTTSTSEQTQTQNKV